MEPLKILIVDDDRNICRMVSMYLASEGYTSVSCHDGSEALNRLRAEHFDLVLLDLMIPSINGWEVCKLIKEDYALPVIMVTARDMIEDKVAGFDAGADDYLVKPFEPKELLMRIRARLKDRWAEQAETKYQVLELDNLRIDLNRYLVWLEGQRMDLKPKEIKLLYFLAKHPEHVFTREQILENVWDSVHDLALGVDSRTVDVHIKNLRQKLKSEKAVWAITTVWGVGYKLEVRDRV